MTKSKTAPGVHSGWRRGATSPTPTARAAATPGPRRCRVEHRPAGATTVLARGLLSLPTNGELVPFAARLRRDGEVGEVVLVDEASGAELARLGVDRGRDAQVAAPPEATPALAAD